MLSDADIYKVSLHGFCDPYKIDFKKWVNDPSSWPTINLINIYEYLVNGTSLYSGEQLRNYKSHCDGYRLFLDCHVQRVMFYQDREMVTQRMCYMSAKVLPRTTAL